MAVVQHPLPLQNARLRRTQFSSGYFKMNQSGVVAMATAAVCILSILFLAQTGRVATAGHRLQELEREHTRLLHEAEQYEYRIAAASRLDVVADKAQKIGLRPATNEQLRYTTIELPAVPVVANAER